MLFALKIFVAVIFICLILGFLRTWRMAHSDEQTAFAGGTYPSPAPDGLYKGRIGRPVSWLGKKFNAASSTGINVFNDEGAQAERYPFKTSKGMGIHDSKDVLRIDYNIAGNPFWVRPILDELVQTSPGNYLGKLELRIIPGYPFTLGFFRLTK